MFILIDILLRALFGQLFEFFNTISVKLFKHINSV